jgi:hypothetical protein
MDVVPFLSHSWADFAHLWYIARCDATLTTTKYGALTLSGSEVMPVWIPNSNRTRAACLGDRKKLTHTTKKTRF